MAGNPCIHGRRATGDRGLGSRPSCRLRVVGKIVESVAPDSTKDSFVSMNTLDNALVTVNRQPGDRRLARYDIADIEEPHWEYTSGGFGKRGRQPSLYAYVYCDGAVEGSVAHSGSHGGDCPHRIAVHVPARHNDPSAMEYLRSVATSKPRSRDGFSVLFHNNAQEPTPKA